VIDLYIHGRKVPVTWKRFPGGETLVRIETPQAGVDLGARIVMRFEGNDDLFNLALLVDAIRRNVNVGRITLDMPYLPYARQDRVCSPGESLSVKVACDFINSLKFDAVFVKDIHSEVGVALLDNLRHMTQADAAFWFTGALRRDETVLVSPDAGANKKVLTFAKEHSFDDVVRADKLRDTRTGAILDTIVYSEHIGSRNFLILDDICDGGRTFVELAKKLRPLTEGKIFLYVTHGIFSAGVDVFNGIVDRIYVTNYMGKAADSLHPLIISNHNK
jgi:ribose-phosphate pyrophosphokinase